MSALRSEAHHFATLAARELEDLITDGFMEEDIFIDADATDEGQGFLLFQTTPSKALELSARFSDVVNITEGRKTHRISLLFRPLTPVARMI